MTLKRTETVERVRVPSTTLLTAHDKTQTLKAWSLETGLSASTIRQRLYSGLSDEQAVDPHRREHRQHAGRGIPDGHPGAASWKDTPFEWDEHCWYVRAVHPRGLTLTQVGTLMGLTRERVRQIEAVALSKLERGLRRVIPNAERADAMTPEFLGAIFAAHDAHRHAHKLAQQLLAQRSFA